MKSAAFLLAVCFCCATSFTNCMILLDQSVLLNNITRTQCNTAHFEQCVMQYDATLGLPQPIVNPASATVNRLNDIIKKEGKAGFARICKASYQLGRCVGRRQLRACFNVKNLEGLGCSKVDAITYETLARVLHYECTRGFKVLMKNWNCIEKTNRTQSAKIQQCAKTFESQIKKDPSKACTYANQFANCLQTIFVKSCNKKCGHFICEVMRHSFSVSMPTCRIQCPKMEGYQKLMVLQL